MRLMSRQASLFRVEPKPRKPLTWYGQVVTKHKGRLADVRKQVPQFERRSFGSNKYLEQIVRKPFGNDGEVPVATVSRDYALVQHAELLGWFASAMSTDDYKADDLECELTISEYGERMHLAITVPGCELDPGDQHSVKMMIDCFNSVDKSCPLEILTSWWRLVCTNGMVAPVRTKSYKKIHLGRAITELDVATYIKNQFAEVNRTRALYKRWFEYPLTLDMVYDWADHRLAKEWGKHAAARVCYIATTGYDGAVVPGQGEIVPHTAMIEEIDEVPGACAPISNAYHLSQALSWVAVSRLTIEDGQSKMRQIAPLIRSFMAGRNRR